MESPAAGMPPQKQQQSEETMPALDDEERKAVQSRVRDRLQARSGSPDGTVTSANRNMLSSRIGSPTRTPKSSRTPGYMTPKSSRRSGKGAVTSRSASLTNRTSSPTGRYHPDPERKLDIRKVGR